MSNALTDRVSLSVRAFCAVYPPPLHIVGQGGSMMHKEYIYTGGDVPDFEECHREAFLLNLEKAVFDLLVENGQLQPVERDICLTLLETHNKERSALPSTACGSAHVDEGRILF